MMAGAGGGRPTYEVEPRSTGLVALDVLRYFYYGGMVFVGLKRFTDALDFFKTVRCHVT
jgi:hypothetical protein